MTTRDLETRPPDSRRQSLLIVGGVTALAFALRLVHLLEARSVVFFRLLVSDGEAYWAWADRIAGVTGSATASSTRHRCIPTFLQF